jgi:hypothetical protein
MPSPAPAIGRTPKALVLAAKSIETPRGVDHPKLIVRADERAKLEMLHDEIERVSVESVLTIHHAIKRNDALERRFNSVKAAQSILANASLRYWLRQTTLLEGVDDSSFVAVAVYDVFGNARQLVQQIGRVPRSSDERRKTRQEAVVLASPEMVSRMEESWDHYLDFERYCVKNTSYLVTNEAALPDRLLATMPDIQYIEGQFWPRFVIEGNLDIDDIRLSASAAVFRLGGGFDKSVVRSEIVEAILNEDRFSPSRYRDFRMRRSRSRTTVGRLHRFSPGSSSPSGSWVSASWSDRVISFLPTIPAESFSMPTSWGSAGCIKPIFARGIPASSSRKPVRVARISSASLDMSERAIRSQATRTRSFENTFTDLLEVLGFEEAVRRANAALAGRGGRVGRGQRALWPRQAGGTAATSSMVCGASTNAISAPTGCVSAETGSIRGTRNPP